MLRKRAEEFWNLSTKQEITADEKQLVGKISIGGNLQPSVLKARQHCENSIPVSVFSFTAAMPQM